MPVLVAKGETSTIISARVVHWKGHFDYAVGALRKIIEQLGHKRGVLKNNTEPPLLMLKGFVWRDMDVELVMEESFVGDHKVRAISEF